MTIDCTPSPGQHGSGAVQGKCGTGLASSPVTDAVLGYFTSLRSCRGFLTGMVVLQTWGTGSPRSWEDGAAAADLQLPKRLEQLDCVAFWQQWQSSGSRSVMNGQRRTWYRGRLG